MRKLGLLCKCFLIGALTAWGSCFTICHSVASSDDVLPAIMAGSKIAAHTVRSGRGSLTVRTRQSRDAGGPVVEREAVHTIVFRGDTYRISSDTTIKRNDPRAGLLPEMMTSVGHTAHKETAVSGQSITYLLDGQATVGSSAAPTSIAGGYYRTLSRTVLLSDPATGITGKGLIDIGELGVLKSPNVGEEASARVIGTELVDGSQCYLVEVLVKRASGKPNRILHLWVDPARGYTVPRLRQFWEGGKYSERTLGLSEDVKLREYVQGVWFPTSVAQTFYSTNKRGESFASMHVEIEYAPDFEVNIPVGDDELALSLPPGTKVHNETLDASYVVPSR